MTVGPTLFAALLWGALLAVAAVFVYELFAVGRELGWW